MMSRALAIFLLLITASVQTQTEEPSIRREDFYNDKKELIQEDYYKDGFLWQSIKFVYKDNRLQRMDIYFNTVLKESRFYYYRLDGSLWQIVRDDRLTYYTPNSMFFDPKDGSLTRVELNRGILRQTEVYERQRLTGNTRYNYYDNGGLKSAVYKGSNESFEEIYDQKGQLTKSTYLYRNGVRQQRSYQYDDTGLMTDETLMENGQFQRWHYLYEEGELSAVYRYLDNSLKQKTLYQDAVREEQYFYKGALSYIERYDKNGKISEEIIK